MKEDKKQDNIETLDDNTCDCAKKNKDHKCHCQDAKINELKKEQQETLEKLKKIEANNTDLVNKIKLGQAELINYRKRKDDETANMLKFANKDLILELLPIVDNFERAISLDDNNLTDDLSKFLAGFKMMYASLTGVLKNYGVEEINPLGEVFDPNREEALMIDNLEDQEDDVVTEVLLKGYTLKGSVIRPAQVKINKK